VEVRFQVFPILLPSLIVHSRRGMPLDVEVGFPKVFDVIDVMPERCEPQPFIRKGRLPYALLRALQV
jgi:hypothetical protein